MAGTSRLWLLDVARGGGIVLVVLMHAYFDPPPWATPGEANVMRALYFLGHSVVPVFFLVSGYLYAREHSRALTAVAHRKGMQLLVPTLIWSAVALLVRWKTGSLSPEQAAMDASLFNAGGQYFYIPMLLILFVATIRLRRAPAALLAPLTGVLLVLGVVQVAAFELAPPSGALGSILAYRDPLMWATFFVAGLLAARSERALSWRAGVLLAICGLALAAAWFVQGKQVGFPNSYFSPFVYLFGFALVLLVSRLIAPAARRAQPAVLEPIAFLGRHSFAIYLAHIPVFIGLVTDYWFPRAQLDSYTGRVTFRFAVGLGGPLCMVALFRLLIPMRAAALVGFQGRERRVAGSQSAGGERDGRPRKGTPLRGMTASVWPARSDRLRL